MFFHFDARDKLQLFDSYAFAIKSAENIIIRGDVSHITLRCIEFDLYLTEPTFK